MIKGKKIGELLQEAYLIDEDQLKFALMEQTYLYTDRKLGEVLVHHGWLKQKTADFFGDEIEKVYEGKSLLIGNILFKAGLLSEKEIQDILQEQRQTGLRFGEIVILKGLIQEETVKFFIENFALYKNKQEFYQYQKQKIKSKLKFNTVKQRIESFNTKKRPILNQVKKVQVIDFNDIDWRG